jgi:DNA-3-methyladenine glycosylase II
VAATADLSAAIAHLRAADPVLGALIDDIGPQNVDERPSDLPTDHYGSLARAIIGQQLSTRAAAAIHRKLTARYGGRLPTPDEVLAEDPDELRVAAGLSHAKVRYLRSLAEHVLNGSLELSKLGSRSDEEVIAALTAINGIGLWSAHMFLIAHLQRPDVLPVGDLGIRKAFQAVYGLPVLPEAAEMERIATPWRPHRTVACLFLWRSLSAIPV